MQKPLRVCWIPQHPGPAFHVEVESITEVVDLLDDLARYDAFQIENGMKPNTASASGVEVFDPENTTDSPKGSWVKWVDPRQGGDNPFDYIGVLDERDKLLPNHTKL
jgi:hypothetical protein